MDATEYLLKWPDRKPVVFFQKSRDQWQARTKIVPCAVLCDYGTDVRMRGHHATTVSQLETLLNQNPDKKKNENADFCGRQAEPDLLVFRQAEPDLLVFLGGA